MFRSKAAKRNYMCGMMCEMMDMYMCMSMMCCASMKQDLPDTSAAFQ